MKALRLTTVTVTGLLAVTLAIFVPADQIRAGTEDDARAMWAELYRKAYDDLRYGSTFEKIEAARMLGQHRKERYVRPLGEELVKDLEIENYRRTPINDPYVKSEIAWAIGHIGHAQGVSYLLKTLDITSKLIQADFVKNGERAQRETAFAEEQEKNRAAVAPQPKNPAEAEQYKEPKVRVVILNQDRPGPYILDNPHQFPYSPDMYWNVSDEFKSIPAPDWSAEDHRIRLLGGATYMNLMRALFMALGEIGSPTAIDGGDKAPGLASYLDDKNLPITRAFAAHAIGAIGRYTKDAAIRKKVIDLLDQRYAQEKDEEVKVRLALAILLNDKSRINYYKELLTYLQSDLTGVRMEAAVAWRELSMGESIENLRAAYAIEPEPVIRGILEEAIHGAGQDNILPVNY